MNESRAPQASSLGALPASVNSITAKVGWHKRLLRWRPLKISPVGVGIGLVAAAVLLALATKRPVPEPILNTVASTAPMLTSREARDSVAESYSQLARLKAQSDVSESLENQESAAAPSPEPPASAAITQPMIAESASLTIVANNYRQAAASVEGLATARGGYIEKLDSQAESGSAKQTSVTLRVPAKSLDALLGDLRKLGAVQQEARQNEEVTDQYVDLDARLTSAQASEKRLLEMLQTRAGKLSDVLDVERELTRVRGDVESMQGQKALLQHRVQYATVDLQLQEEYRAQLGAKTSPLSSLHNALIDGLQNLEAGVMAILTFALAYGPSLVLWIAVLGVPTWLLWRRRQRRAAAAE